MKKRLPSLLLCVALLTQACTARRLQAPALIEGDVDMLTPPPALRTRKGAWRQRAHDVEAVDTNAARLEGNRSGRATGVSPMVVGVVAAMAATSAAIGGTATGTGHGPGAAREGCHFTSVPLLVGGVEHARLTLRDDRPTAPQLVVGILSGPQRRARRDAARATWATRFAGDSWRLLFVIGNDPLDPAVNAAVLRESCEHGDIVRVSVPDEPRNGHLKELALWQVSCSDALFSGLSAESSPGEAAIAAGGTAAPAYVVKANDQTLVDVEAVFSALGDLPPVGLYAGIDPQQRKPVQRSGPDAEAEADMPEVEWPAFFSEAYGEVVSTDIVACALKRVASEGYRPLHVEGAATGVLAHACGARPRSDFYGLRFVGNRLKDEQLAEGYRIALSPKVHVGGDFLPHHFNKRVSRSLGELRPTFPELRDRRCAGLLPEWEELRDDGWDTSVIITFVDEEPTTLVRTVRTLLENTPPALLREIILVDDGSSFEWLEQTYPSRTNSAPSAWPSDVQPAKMLDYIVAMDPAKIRVLHVPRMGFIKARMEGIRATHGRTYTIMESHCEPLPGWLEPLLATVRENPQTIANPLIEAIRDDDFTFVPPAYMTMDYDDKFEMKWGMPGAVGDKANRPRPTDGSASSRPWGNPDPAGTRTYMPYASPVHAGGIYTATREFFEYLQGYDPDMNGFSSENLELAFRAWMCGTGEGERSGRNVIVPCSIVGHVYRMRTPSAALDIVTPASIRRNTKRMIEAWLDAEGDGAGYNPSPSDAAQWLGTCQSGLSCEMPSLLHRVYKARGFDLKDVDAGNLSERKQWIRQHCRPFSWFMENVAEPQANGIEASSRFLGIRDLWRTLRQRVS